MTTSIPGIGNLVAVYHGLFDTSPDPIYIEDETGVVLDANQAACRFQGMTREQLVGSNVISLVPAAERERLERDFRRWFSGELSTYEGYTQKPDGAVVRVEVHGIRIDYQGRPAVILHVRDVSELHRKSHELALIFEHMISGCALHEVLVDGAGRPVDYRFLAVNKSFERMVGKKAEDVIGKTVLEVFPMTERFWIETYGRVALNGESVNVENYSRALDKHFEVSAYSPEPGKFVTVFFETTERHKALRAIKDQQERERQVLAAQKLESLGVLAGGIAHDFNNLLVGVLGNAELALSLLSAGHPSHDYVEQIRLAGKRASELTQLMLAYSGRARFNQGPLRINDLIRETLRLVSLAMSKKVTVHMELDEAIPAVIADVAQVRQLIMNVITNAADAIGDRPGEVSIASACRDLDATRFRNAGDMPPLEPGRYVVVEVRDTGCGIAPENLRRIFEPFYTSKFSGRGLGLAAVLGIVKSHRGGIELASEVGSGTTFRFAFPAADEKVVVEASAGSPAAPGPPADRRRRVLVVDDEPVVRTVLHRCLERAGYAVTEAENGRVALDCLRAGPPFDLVLLDLTMPHLSGEETLALLHEHGYSAPVVVMSGYAESDAAERFAMPMIRGYLEKPFDLETVLVKVRAAISGP